MVGDAKTMTNSFYALVAFAVVTVTVLAALLARCSRRRVDPRAAESAVASWTTRWQEYQDLACQITPGVRLTTKDGWFWRCLAWALCLASLGRIKRDRFLKEYATTLGPLQAYPRHWPQIPLDLLAHETRHTRQFLVAGWFVPIAGWLGQSVRAWVGLLPMTIVYVMFPVPALLAWGRFRLELDAESFAWKLGLERGWLSPNEVRRRAPLAAQQIASWMYLKAWPNKWAAKSYAHRAEQIITDWQTSIRDGECGRS